MLSAEYLAGVPGLIAIRVVATVVFAGLYLRDRQPLHLIVLAGWSLYALSAVFLFSSTSAILPLPQNVQFALSAAGAYIGTALLMLAASCYIHPGILKAARSISVLMLVLFGPGLLLSSPAEIAVYFVALQGFSFFIGSCVLWFERQAALKNLSRAYYGLALVVVVGLFQVVVALTGQNSAHLSLFLGSGASLTWVLVFIFAEHHETMAKLRQSAIRLAQAENLTKIGYWERNVLTEQAYWSSGHYKVFGVPQDWQPLSSEELYSITHPDDLEEVKRVYSRIQQGSPYEYNEFRIVLPGGEVRWIKSDTTQQEGAEHWVFGVTQDITEQKLMELRVEQALEEKTAHLEALARGLPTLLHAMSEIVYAPQPRQVSGTEYGELMAELQRRARHLLTLHQGMLHGGFSLSAPIFLQSVCQSFRDEFECHIEEIHIAPGLILPIGAVAHELLSNSVLHGRGTATSTDARSKHSNGDGRISLQFYEDGGELVLAVHDSGPGFTPECMERFQDREPHVGTTTFNGGGIGLAVVKSLAARLNAQLTLANKDGARVELRLTPEEQRYS